MNRAFSQREKLMLGILTLLILAAVYYFLAFQPIQTRILEANTRSEDAQSSMLVEQVRVGRRAQMLQEIEALKAAGVGTKAEIPPYNNLRNVMVQLDAILAPAASYEIGFSAVNMDQRLVRRPISITFAADTYAQAREMIAGLSQCRFRCTLDSVTVTSQGTAAANPNLNTQPVQVSVEVTFYEKNTAPLPAPDPVAPIAP